MFDATSYVPSSIEKFFVATHEKRQIINLWKEVWRKTLWSLKKVFITFLSFHIDMIEDVQWVQYSIAL